jgi:hypothetical protein
MAILNGFGISVGDSVIGLQALHAAQTLGRIDPAPVLFRSPGLRPLVDQVYPLAADMASVRPIESFSPEGFDEVIDMRDFAFDPAFRGVAMIDFFLGRLGLAPDEVPAALRRNTWLSPRLALPPAPQRYALVCPNSSMALRDMPQAVHARILARLIDHGHDVLTQGTVPADLAGRVGTVPDCATLAALCAVVAGARLVISTDTAIVHLADAFAVPCLAFFTTHRPEWRMRDYPRAQAVHLVPEGLPEALEFERGPEDIAATHAAWLRAPARIDQAVADFLASVTPAAAAR